MQEIYYRLLAEAEERGDATGMCRLLLEQGQHLAQQNDGAGALGCFQRALATAVAIKDPILEERALEPLGVVLFHVGGVVEAVAAFQRLLELVRQAGDRPKEARLLAMLGALHLKRNQLDEAAACLRQAGEQLRELRDVYSYFAVLKLRAEASRRRGRTSVAVGLLEEALRMVKRADQLHEVEEILGELAELHLTRGESAPARTRLEEGYAADEALDDVPGQAAYLLRLSDLDRQEGNSLAALFKVRAALDRVLQIEDAELSVRASVELGLILQRQGRERPARAALAGAVQRARAAGLPPVEVDALHAYAWFLVQARQGDYRDPGLAVRAVTRALEISPQPGRISFVILSRAYRLQGLRTQARQALEKAQTLDKK